MIPKAVKRSGFFPVMKWSNDYLLGLRDVTGGFAGWKPKFHPMPAEKNRKAAMLAMKRTRKRLARFLPRHGRLMVRKSGGG